MVGFSYRASEAGCAQPHLGGTYHIWWVESHGHPLSQNVLVWGINLCLIGLVGLCQCLPDGRSEASCPAGKAPWLFPGWAVLQVGRSRFVSSCQACINQEVGDGDGMGKGLCWHYAPGGMEMWQSTDMHPGQLRDIQLWGEETTFLLHHLTCDLRPEWGAPVGARDKIAS